MAANKSTVYVAGFPAQTDENQLLEAFVTFGDVLEISIPHEPHDGEYEEGRQSRPCGCFSALKTNWKSPIRNNWWRIAYRSV